MTRDEASEILLRHHIPHMTVYGSADLINVCGSVVARRLAALEDVAIAAGSLRAALLSPNVEMDVLAAGIAPLAEAAVALRKALAALDEKEATNG